MGANDDDSLLDARYVRWQGLSIAQLTVAIGVMSAWSAGAVVYGVSFLHLLDHHSCSRGWLLGAIVVLLLASALSFFAVVSRTLDFKLTARKVRKRVLDKRGNPYTKSLTLASLTADQFGKFTWVLFSGSVLLFAVRLTIVSITVGINLDLMK
ncbi:MAG: hypothetical protein ABIO49_03500 [Dokdonella sp.]